jgi:hypothetical protein
MLLSNLRFGSYLTYTPRGNSEQAQIAKQMMVTIKQDTIITQSNEPCSEYLVGMIFSDLHNLPFKDLFGRDTYLVPVPKSSLMQPGTLWVPLKIAEALERKQLGTIMNCLKRTKAVPKAATSQASQRPKPLDHYNSIIVNRGVHQPQKIVLVDDIVTRGATLLGCASLLKEAFPEALIFGFAMMRTISQEVDFRQVKDPCIGTISLSNGDAFRDP